MQPDYQRIMAERQQQEQNRYQKARDPFEYGRQVAQRRYSEIMSGLDAQRASTNQSYGDMYQQARQMAVGRRAAAGPTLSGGMGQQQRDFVSTAEMQQLGQIGQARDQANRDMFAQAQSAMSNAQLEGQQATQMELQNQQAKLQLAQQTQQILADDKMSREEKLQQLEALGVDPSKLPVKEKAGFLGWGKALGEDATATDVLSAVGKTALAAGAVFVFGPLAIKLVGAAGAKLLGVGAAGSKSLFGLAGWKSLFAGAMKTAGTVGPYTPFVAGAAKGAPLLQPILAPGVGAAASQAARQAVPTFYDYVFNAQGQPMPYVPEIPMM